MTAGQTGASRGDNRNHELESERSPAIAISGLTREFGEGTITAVDDVSLTVDPGTVVGLLGPNGAGKTTTIKAALGLLVPTDGEVLVDGADATERPAEVYRRASAVLEGARNVYWRLTVRENLAFFASLQGIDPASAGEYHEYLLETLNLQDRAGDPVRDLSRGMKQKVAIACALARRTPIVFLDEPTLGLDVEASRDLRRELRRLADEEDRTVLLSSHDMDVVEAVCDRVVVLSDGRVVADDTVENLIDVFRSQAYRISVSGALPDETRRTLVEEYEARFLGDSQDSAAFEVSLVEGDQFYRLVDELEAADVVPGGIESIEPDLEEIFLQITGTDGAGGGERA